MELTAWGLMLATLFAPITVMAGRLAAAAQALARPGAGAGADDRLSPTADVLLAIALVIGLAALILSELAARGQWADYAAFMFGPPRARWWYVAAGAALGWGAHSLVSRLFAGRRDVRGSRSAALSIDPAGPAGANPYLRVYGAGWLGPIAVLSNIAEEFIWRGFYLKAFTAAGGPLGAAIALSSLAYGSYHYTFGVRMVAVHALLGAFYSLLFLAARDLTLPIATHVAFNLSALREIRRVLARTPGALTHA